MLVDEPNQGTHNNTRGIRISNGHKNRPAIRQNQPPNRQLGNNRGKAAGRLAVNQLQG